MKNRDLPFFFFTSLSSFEDLVIQSILCENCRGSSPSFREKKGLVSTRFDNNAHIKVQSSGRTNTES